MMYTNETNGRLMITVSLEDATKAFFHSPKGEEFFGHTIGLAQHSSHPETVDVHIIEVIEQITKVVDHLDGECPCLDFADGELESLYAAALIHDIGKGMPGIRTIKNGELMDPGHADKGVEYVDQILPLLPYQADSALVKFLVGEHMNFHNLTSKGLRKYVLKVSNKYGFSNLREAKDALFLLCILGAADKFSKLHEKLAILNDIEWLRTPVAESDLSVTREELTERFDRSSATIEKIFSNIFSRCQAGEIQNNKEDLIDAAEKRLARLDAAKEVK